VCGGTCSNSELIVKGEGTRRRNGANSAEFERFDWLLGSPVRDRFGRKWAEQKVIGRSVDCEEQATGVNRTLSMYDRV
jgi:hypothetical protein